MSTNNQSKLPPLIPKLEIEIRFLIALICLLTVTFNAQAEDLNTCIHFQRVDENQGNEQLRFHFTSTCSKKVVVAMCVLLNTQDERTGKQGRFHEQTYEGYMSPKYPSQELTLDFVWYQKAPYKHKFTYYWGDNRSPDTGSGGNYASAFPAQCPPDNFADSAPPNNRFDECMTEHSDTSSGLYQGSDTSQRKIRITNNCKIPVCYDAKFTFQQPNAGVKHDRNAGWMNPREAKDVVFSFPQNAVSNHKVTYCDCRGHDVACESAYPVISGAFAEPFAAGDAKQGNILFDKNNCNRCHVTMIDGDANAIFTRKDRKVKTPDQLVEQMKRCGSVGIKLTPQEERHVAAYLNQAFYKFK